SSTRPQWERRTVRSVREYGGSARVCRSSASLSIPSSASRYGCLLIVLSYRQTVDCAKGRTHGLAPPEYMRRHPPSIWCEFLNRRILDVVVTLPKDGRSLYCRTSRNRIVPGGLTHPVSAPV